MPRNSKEIIGYTDRISVEPGDRVAFMISCHTPRYRADIVRLIHGDPHPNGPGRKEQPVATPVSGAHPGRVQEIHTGSYAIVPNSPLLAKLTSFTLAAWIYPTLPNAGRQGLLTKWDGSRNKGYGLFVGPDGGVVAWLGDGGNAVHDFRTGIALESFRWYFVAVVFDAEAGRVRLYQQAQAPWASSSASAVVDQSAPGFVAGKSNAPLLMAAGWDGRRTVDHYDGKIDSPAVFRDALDQDEIDRLRQGRLGDSKKPIASWNFSLDIPTVRVADVSGNGLHGETVNSPARGVTGHNWNFKVVNWTQAPEEYGAIHFHRDDLDDARWEVDFELTVPEDMASGIYAARVVSETDEDRIPFFVRPKGAAPTADVVFLAPTLTYLAYANGASISVAQKRGVEVLFVPKTYSDIDRYVDQNDLRSLYDRHLDGMGVYYASWRRPLTVRPDYYNQFRGYAHGLGADLFLLDWMQEKGFTYDVVTDHDLHERGAQILQPYRVVITGGHPEYWTGSMLDALEQYQGAGGRLMYVGGNGFWGVVSLAPDRPHVAELRRVQTSGFIWQAPAGEYCHSTTGEFGGNWNCRGRSPHKICGVSCTAVGSDNAMPYRRQRDSFDPRAAFIFEGIAHDEVIGDFGLMQGGAGGDEVDRLDYAQGSPPHALVLATASGFSDVYLYIPEDVLHDRTYPSESGQRSDPNPRVRADMVFFELANGGAVFSTGSITWCGALSHNNYDNNVSRITENVLRRFLDPASFSQSEG